MPCQLILIINIVMNGQLNVFIREIYGLLKNEHNHTLRVTHFEMRTQ